MSKAPKATEARDVMLSELLICIQAAPEGDRYKLLAAVRTFMGEQEGKLPQQVHGTPNCSCSIGREGRGSYTQSCQRT